MGNPNGKLIKGITAISAFTIGLALAGCAKPKVVEISQAGDPELPCPQLQSQLDEAEKLRVAAEGSRNTTGGNVVMGFLFFPGALLTHANVNEAVQAAEARKALLTGLMSQKNCPTKPAPAKPAAK